MEQTAPTPDAEELRFKIPDGTLLAGKSWGEDSATTNVIAIHGYLDSSATFDPLAPMLVAAAPAGSVRIVAIDLSGHGKSSHRPNHTNYSLSWIIEVVTVADALGWDTFALLCHSMGTHVGVTVAGAVPKRVQKLILLDAMGSSGIPPEMAPVYMERSLQARLQLMQRQPRVYKSTEELVARMMKSSSKLTEASARKLVERGSELVPGGYTFSHDARLRGVAPLFQFTEAEVVAYIHRIQCPVLMLWASTRWYKLDFDKLKKREAHFRDITVVNVEGNHHVHLERPDIVFPFISAFLAAQTAQAKL